MIDHFPQDGDPLEGQLRSPLENVCQQSLFSHLDCKPKATQDELETTSTLLRNYTCAIFCAQSRRKPKQVDLALGNVAGLFYPKLADNFRDLNVRKSPFMEIQVEIPGLTAGDLVKASAPGLAAVLACAALRVLMIDLLGLSDVEVEFEGFGDDGTPSFSIEY